MTDINLVNLILIARLVLKGTYRRNILFPRANKICTINPFKIAINPIVLGGATPTHPRRTAGYTSEIVVDNGDVGAAEPSIIGVAHCDTVLKIVLYSFEVVLVRIADIEIASTEPCIFQT